MSRSSNITPIDNYRGIDRLSYSALSQYKDNRLGFYMEYILKDEGYLKKKSEDKDENYSLKMGTLIDCLMTDEDNYVHLYYESPGIEEPKPQMLSFCQFLYKETRDGIDFPMALKNAYEKLKAKNKGKLGTGFAKFVENFENDGEEYYNELIKAGDKIVITADEYNICKKVAEKIKYSKAFRDIGEVHTKVVILFDYDDTPLKCEIDKISIDHSTKTIYLIDYKTSYDIENFIWTGFLKRNYYIQASLYKFALQQWALDHYPGYKVENMQFRVMDVTTKSLEPLVYKTSDKMYEQGFTGFYVGKKYYKGISEILREIKDSIEIDNWAISVENHKNNGVVMIPDFGAKTDED